MRPTARAVRGRTGPIAALSAIAFETAQPATHLLAEFAGLALRQGRISYPDWVRLRLFDPRFWIGRDRAAVAGERRAAELDHQANPREWRGLRANRLAWSGYLAAHGFAVAKTIAIFAPGLAAPGKRLLRSREELRGFLKANTLWPLLCEPVEGAPAAGSPSALAGCDVLADALFAQGGRRFPLSGWIDYVCENHPAGYLFRTTPPPHPGVAGLEDVSHVLRLTTASDSEGPRLLSAIWLVAERSGDRIKPFGRRTLAVRLDRRTGRVVSVTRGSGLSFQEVEGEAGLFARLVDTGALEWPRLKAAAIEAARALRTLRLISFDIVPTIEGPVILEMAPPDLMLDQFVERRGLLDGRISTSLTDQRQAA